MTIDIQPVIMAGGSGTRLWPLSRSGFPKQFLILSGNTSLFQQAVTRLQDLAEGPITVAAPLVVGNEEHRFLVLDQLREVQAEPSAALLEPMGRNTAPAVTLAALAALEAGSDPVLVVTPADQTVTNEVAFATAVRRAVLVAAEGAIAILGITPDRPETGYGYIKIDASSDGATAAPKVARFVEKPDLAKAEAYLAEGGYFWNAGMFVLKASVWITALERFRPDIASATRTAWATESTSSRRPNPPPSKVACNVTASTGTPATWAATARAIWGTWVGAQIVTCPLRTCAVQFMVSMVAWARYGALYQASTTRAACASAE